MKLVKTKGRNGAIKATTSEKLEAQGLLLVRQREDDGGSLWASRDRLVLKDSKGVRKVEIGEAARFMFDSLRPDPAGWTSDPGGERLFLIHLLNPRRVTFELTELQSQAATVCAAAQGNTVSEWARLWAVAGIEPDLDNVQSSLAVGPKLVNKIVEGESDQP